MAINSPIIVAGPTKQRLHILDQPIPAHPVAPEDDYIDIVDGSPTYVSGGPPTREGQVYFHVRTVDGFIWATMYVGINLNSVLTWVVVTTGELLDKYTGLPYDPLFGHTGYDPIDGG